jgi:hypothetical protein
MGETVLKYKILMLCVAMLPARLFCQQLSNQVMVPLAGVSSNTSVSYTQTAGETAVEIAGCSGYALTQGFQQPRYIKIVDNPKSGTGVNVYPNPATDFITVELYGETAEIFRIDIISITGKVVYSVRKCFDTKFWYTDPMNIESLLKGFYLVRIYSEDGLINRSFKIEKL